MENNNTPPPQRPSQGGRGAQSQAGAGGNQLIVFMLILLIGSVIVAAFIFPRKEVTSFSYSEFVQKVKANEIIDATIVEQTIMGQYKAEDEAKQYRTFIPYGDLNLLPLLLEHNVKVTGESPKNDWLMSALVGILPFVLLLVAFFFMFRRIQGSNNKAMQFGQSNARRMKKEDVGVTFKDVAGCDEAKEELVEVVDFLKNPGKFTKIGARIPRGLLLVGPPGTGKTLLAKAVAGEASVPFFSMSGSEFVEMFAGVGASRMRDLFEQAKKSAPSIIFIDELDAVGRSRGAGYGGGHDEREQTLNQMLVEMDGFGTNTHVIVVAATNRPDVLDNALLRPGRFDRQVVVDSPDVKGRENILKIHAAKVQLESNVDLALVARATPGFSGADLMNLVNEAALNAARHEKTKVSNDDFELARDKVLMGPERRSMLMSEVELVNTAYHEAGHTLVAILLKNVDQIHKVTIIPRGRSLGSTWTLPADGRHSTYFAKLNDQIAMALAGRVAEEYKFGAEKVTAGAASDIERVSELARRMVCEWGMSELGPIAFGQKEAPIFLGKEIARHKDYSELTAQKIDNEIERIVETQYARCRQLIAKNGDKLETIARALLEKEILDLQDLEKILRMKIERAPEKIVPVSRKGQEKIKDTAPAIGLPEQKKRAGKPKPTKKKSR